MTAQTHDTPAAICPICGGKRQPSKRTCSRCEFGKTVDQSGMPTVRHRTSCPDPSRVKPFTGRLGDPLLGCVSCGAFEVIRRLGTAAQREATDAETSPHAADDRPAPQPTPQPARTGYACRVHYAPVTWRGTGCNDCQADMRRGVSARAARDTRRKEAAAAKEATQ